jgi:hypothetical protein
LSKKSNRSQHPRRESPLPERGRVLPSVTDQFFAVLNTPIPFFLAVMAIAWGIWRAMEWRYQGIIDLTKTMHQLAQTEAQTGKAKQVELEATVKSLKEELTNFAERNKGDQALQPAIQDLSRLTLTAQSQLEQLGQANNAVSNALTRVPIEIRGRTYMVEPVYVPEDDITKMR